MGNLGSVMGQANPTAQQSSQKYVTGITKNSISNVCPLPAASYTESELMALFPNGVASDGLLPDSATGRISLDQLAQHVANLEGSGILLPRPKKILTAQVATDDTDTPKLIAQDAELFNRLKNEYCHYEQRYRYALKNFLTLATSRNQADNGGAQDMLAKTKTLNLRVNSVLEVMNYLAQARVDVINLNKTSINNLNTSINGKLVALTENYKLLNSQSAIVTTQKEMVRFTEEKNNYTTNQISAWAALNVVALGTIFYVYRN